MLDQTLHHTSTIFQHLTKVDCCLLGLEFERYHKGKSRLMKASPDRDEVGVSF